MASEVLKLIFRGQDDTSKAVRSLRTNLDKAQKGIDNVKRSLGGMTGAIGAAAGVAGLGALAKSALDSADKLGKMSQTLGTSASELASLQLAANFAGVETDKFNKLMQTFQKRVGEAADGTGQAKATLDKFGISAQYLASLPLDQQLALIADEFKNLKTPAEQAAAASDLGSNAFIRMIPLLQGGSDGLKDVRDEFRRTGMEIEDNQIDAIEDFNDAMTKLGGIIQTAMIKGLADAAPVMEEFADKAAEMAVPLTGELFDGLEWILKNIDAIKTGIQALIAAMVVSKVVAFAAGIAQIVTAMGGFAAVLAAITGPIGIVVAAIVGATAAYVAFKDEIDAVVKQMRDGFLVIFDKAGDAIKSVTSIFGDSDDQLKKNNKTTGDATDETDGLTASIDDLQDIVVTATRRPLPDFADNVENIADEEITAATKTDEFREAIEKLQKAARTGADDIKDFDKDLADFEKTVASTTATQEELDEAIRNSIEGLTGVTFEQRELREEIAKVERALEVVNDRFGENSEEAVVLRDRLKELNVEYLESLEQLGSLTDEQQAFIDKIAETDREAAELKARILQLSDAYNKGLITGEEYADSVSRINQELKDLKDQGLKDADKAVSSVFSTEAVDDFSASISKGGDVDRAFGDLIDSAIGSDGTKSAINDCFGVKPVQDFGQGIRDLFTGNGSPLGAFESALGSLSDALGDFFRDGELEFDLFKEAILDALADIAAGAVASVGINFLKNLIPGLNSGGMIDGYATGGRVTGMGGPKEDKVLARLSPGEYVINAATVSKFGANFFDQINSGKMPGFALGGLTGGPAPAALPELTSTLGFIPGLNAVAGFLSIINSIIGLLSGGPSTYQYRQANNQLEAGKNQWISDNVFGAFEGLSNVFGPAMIDYYKAEYGIGANGIPVITKSSPIVDIISRIGAGTRFPGGNNSAGYNQNKDIFDSMGGLSDELAQFIYEYLGGKLLSVSIPDFNMDDVVARLFNSAQGVAGGSLTLAAREMGGPLERGQPALVGEGGPELFVPGRGGTVSPITRDGAQELVTAVHEVRDEISDLRRQFSRALSGGQLAGGRG